MANNEAALQTLIERYESETPDSIPLVERLEYPRFVDRYAGFLASDAALLLTVEPLDAEGNEKKIRVVRLREYEEGADIRGQLIRPQSFYQAHQMAEGTARHDKRVEAYEEASVLRRGLIRVIDPFRISTVLLPLKSGKKMPDIIDYQAPGGPVKLVAQA